MASDRSIRKKQAEESKREKALIDDFIRRSMQDPGGREFFWQLLLWCGVGRQPFAANALQTSFNCGELNIGQQVYSRLLEVDPAGYVRMIEEKQDGTRDGNEGNSNGAGSGSPEPGNSAAGEYGDPEPGEPGDGDPVRGGDPFGDPEPI